MKKLLSLSLCMLFLLSLFASCAHKQAATDGKQPSVPDDDGYVDVFEEHDDKSDMPVIVEHVMLDSLPSSYTLVGTKHLPPIDNQGGIGSCASEGITYMQFTNAVSRYLHSKNENVNWDPSSGNEKYIFAPKFTYLYSGAGTAWVYDVIKDHGCQVVKDCQFYGHGSYKTGISNSPYSRKAQSYEWQFGKKDLKDALNYRISDYEQIWMNTLNNELTTSEKGQDLLYKIKDAVAQGNVVVTGGFSSNWQYAQISAADAAKSNLAKPNDWVCFWCNGLGGGHQVSVVGYDDDFVYTYEGVTMKGAFLVANSWGDYWKNDGYFWVTYDSINKVSEYEILNELPGRQPSMDQFCFIYWDKDIVVGMPDAYVTIELSITDREGFYVELTRTDSTDNCVTHVPALFDYGANFKNIHNNGQYADQANGENYVTFSGKIDSAAETGYVTLGFNPLELEGKDFDDYMWGVNIYSTTASAVVKKISLYDGKGKLRSEIVPSEDIAKIKPDDKACFVFDMGNELSKYHDVGSYKLKSKESGLYVKLNVLPLESCESVLDAVTFNVTFDLINRDHVIVLDGTRYILDIQGRTIDNGVAVKFNAPNFKRPTQTWRVVQLEDGSYNIRLATDTRYAMGMVDGEIVLVSGKGIRDHGAWIFENAGNENMTSVVRSVDGKPTVSGRIPVEVAENELTIGAYTAAGELVKTYKVTGETDVRTFVLTVDDLPAGTYCFTFTDRSGKLVSSCYVMTVK